MGCSWEVLRGTWLVVCYGVDFLVLRVSHIRRRCFQIQSDCGNKPYHLMLLDIGVYAGIMCFFFECLDYNLTDVAFFQPLSTMGPDSSRF